MDNIMMIAAAEARIACKDEPDIKERFRKAARVMHDHWMLQGYEPQFKAALAAAMLESDEADKERYQAEFDGMAKAAALIQALQLGIPIDLESMAVEMPKDAPAERIGLREIWVEIAGGPR